MNQPQSLLILISVDILSRKHLNLQFKCSSLINLVFCIYEYNEVNIIIMFEIWIGPILLIIFCILSALLKWYYMSQYPIYKNINTKEYYQILYYRDYSLIYIRRKRKFLIFYFDVWSEQDQIITDEQLELNYIRIK